MLPVTKYFESAEPESVYSIFTDRNDKLIDMQFVRFSNDNRHFDKVLSIWNTLKWTNELPLSSCIEVTREYPFNKSFVVGTDLQRV